MERNQLGDKDRALDHLFHAYREACGEPQPSANFMPQIWARIEERQRSVFLLARWARTLATAAALLSLGMAAYLYTPHSNNSPFSVESYVEALSASHAQDNPDLIEIADAM